MMRKFRQRLAAVSLTALLMGLIPATVAFAATETIYEDTTLSGDHTGTIYVAGDGITLDCAGFTIRAPGDFWGIYVTGHDVTVQNCHVTGFTVGITFQFVDGGTLINSTSFDNFNAGIRLHQSTNVTVRSTESYGNGLSGVFLRGSDENVIKNVDSTGNGTGLLLFAGSDENEIKNSFFEGNHGVGISVDGSNGNIIKANVVTDTVEGSSVDNGKGVWLHNASTNNMIVGNTSQGNNSQGFFLSDVHDNTLMDNTSVGNSDGYLLQNADIVSLKGNRAVANRNNGFALIVDSSGNQLRGNRSAQNALQGFVLVDGQDNLFTDNEAEGNSNGFLTFRTVDNEFRENVAKENEIRGFAVLGPSDRNVLVDNEALDNGSDGFQISGGVSNDLIGNTADRNGGHGYHLLETEANTVEDNSSKWNGRGIAVNDSASNYVRGNSVRHNTLEGISVVNGSSLNAVVDNTSRNNGLDLFQDVSSQGAGNIFADNSFLTSAGIE